MQWILIAFYVCYVPPGEAEETCTRFEEAPGVYGKRYETNEACAAAAKVNAGVWLVRRGMPYTYFRGMAECHRVAKEVQA